MNNIKNIHIKKNQKQNLNKQLYKLMYGARKTYVHWVECILYSCMQVGIDTSYWDTSILININSSCTQVSLQVSLKSTHLCIRCTSIVFWYMRNWHMSCTWGCTSTPSMSLNVSLTSLITFSAFTFPLRSSSCRLAVVQEAKIIEKEIDGEREKKLNIKKCIVQFHHHYKHLRFVRI